MRVGAMALAVVVAAVGATLVLACASLIGVSDEVDYSEGGVRKDSSVDAHVEEAGRRDRRASDRVEFDGGGFEAADGCHACVEVPAGWSGPVVLYDGTGSPPTTPPVCASPYSSPAYLGNAKPTFDGGACECSCSMTSAPDCDAGVIATFSNASCLGGTSPSCTDAAAAQGACITSPACSAGSLFVSLGGVVPSGGTCTAAQPTLPTPTWLEVGQACSLDGGPTRGPCLAGQLCAPAPPLGFEDTLCILQAGDLPCPGGTPYTKPHVYFADFDDKRNCPCSCGSPEGGACQSSIQIYDAGGCTAPVPGPTVVVDAACVYLGTREAPISVEYAAQGAACAPAAAVIAGTVGGKSPTTLCCTK